MTDQLQCEGALRLLVARLDADLNQSDSDVGSGSGSSSSAWLVRLDSVDERGGNLGLKSLDQHPVDALTGFIAPDDWFAVGVVSDGWAHSLDQRPAARVARQRIRAIFLLARDGSEASAMRRYGHDELEFLDGPAEGDIPDTLRRVLRLPTAPPSASIAEFMAKIWLEGIIGAGQRGKHATKLSWERAAALHPAMDLVQRPASPNNLQELAAEIAGRMDWERLRRQMARGHDSSSGTVAWMDAGMFARRMVNGRPPIDDLAKRAAHRLTAPAASRLRQTLAAWELGSGAVSAA